MSRATLLAILLLGAPVFAHGGQFRGPRGGAPPGLPSQPNKPARTGHGTHTWLTWWGYNQFKVLDFRRLQRERRGPITQSAKRTDPDAWRKTLRNRLVPVMLEALADDDKEVRTAAAVALGKFRAIETIPDLQRLVEQDNIKEVREAALQGLLLMGDAHLYDYFVKIIKRQGEEMRLRGFALMALGRIGDARSRTFLLGFFESKNKRARRMLPSSTGDRRTFRISALTGLLMSKNAELGETFLSIANDKKFDEDVRAHALTCVGKMGTKSELPAVLEILQKESSEQIRRSAAVVVGLLASKEDEAIVKPLARVLKKDQDKIVRHFTVISLGQIGGDLAFKQLKRQFRYANKEDRGFYLLAMGLSHHPDAAKELKREIGAADAIQGAAAALGLGILGIEDHRAAVRKEFAETKAWAMLQSTMLALGMLNDRQSAKPIRNRMIVDRQPALRSAAGIAYAMLEPSKSVDLFLEILRGAKNQQTLGMITQVMAYLASERAAKPLQDICHDTKLQRQTRAYALVALGRLADTDEYPYFITLAFDTNYFVRCDPFDEVVTIF